MTSEIQSRQCVDGDLAALEATEPPGANISRNLLVHQAAGTLVYAAAWRKHQPAGTVMLDLLADHTPELKHLFVHESGQGTGIGTALCIWTEAYAAKAGFNKLHLSAGIENWGARQLYARLGVTPTGRATTTIYPYVDDNGQEQWATETDHVFEKALID
ncbi:GNAT family N-acetyltransferase [Arthrobacter sp. B0490]|uniref:GNAT family N-acetyltransferase n=1 Tax=Arthrobacter sp. B0490 TaxID=2058891 RepID=UPI000CE52CFE|nr:GNAT family N-acetyltransferase [Arthrobacter sp. B0490]